MSSIANGEFLEPRLVEVYDAECPWSREDDLFVDLVGGEPMRVLDLGCGTGRLALGLAGAGHRVTGVDPAPASIAAARRKPGADAITWIEGDSSTLPAASFDVAVMTSHVAQFFVSDASWATVLADLGRAVVPGGRVMFDARDPAARGWERWNVVDSARDIRLPHGSVVAITTEVTEFVGDAVTSVHRYVFANGDRLAASVTLRFRSLVEIEQPLRTAGFEVTEVFGGWHRQPVGDGDGEFIVVARRRVTPPA